MGGDNRAEFYDATSAIWLELFGEHVHVGYYSDAKDVRAGKKSWKQAQDDHIQALLDVAGVKKAQSLVDLGCGYGGTAVAVAHKLGCRAVGVNISPYQVAAANALAARSGFDPARVHFVVGDALAPGLPQGGYDLVMAVESSTYMPDKDKFVSQLAALAAPGGTVILVDFCRKPGPWTPGLTARMARMDKIFATAGNWKSADDFKDMMAANGLDIVRSEDWTTRIKGFWAVPTIKLLFREEHPKQRMPARLLGGVLRLGRCSWLLLRGGKKVWATTLSVQTGVMARTVQGGLDCGDIQYHVIVATKP